MIIPHRVPCLEGKISVEGDEEHLKLVLSHLLKKRKNMDNIKILPSGNAAIFIVSKIVKDILGEGNILIPDMGSWRGFLRYPKMLNLNPIKIKTNLGIVDIEELISSIEKYNPKALFLTSLAGYLAPQPLKEIKKVCEEFGVLFVEDVSGKIGDDSGYGDVVVCSMGSPKIINCEYGGFLAFDEEIKEKLKKANKLDELNALIKTYKVPNFFGLMKEEAKNAKKVYKRCVYFSNIIKSEMENAYFKDKEGVCVFLEYENPHEVTKFVDSCVRLDNGKSIITKCPLYDRVLRNGVVVEIKKMDILNIGDDDIIEIVNIIKKASQLK
ncbi:hypothetical protein [Methanotorris formicicus]|nr:hypothetical protein [Methanotorris formicicus]